MRKSGAWIGVLALLASACGDDDGSADPADAGAPEIDAFVEPPDAWVRPRGDAGATEVACAAATRAEVPDEPEAAGPWPVGVRGATVGRLNVDVWYPARPGSESAASPVVYDIRDWLPPSQRDRIPDGDEPVQTCDCYRDLPIDDASGPYPVIVFVHGTAGFRSQSLSFLTHWASRGFVVIATEHPGLFLGDMLALTCRGERQTGRRDLAGDVDTMLEALRAPSGELAALAGHVDTSRIALAGHSAGGIVTELADREGVRVVISLASSRPSLDDPGLEGSLFVAAVDDAVVPYSSSITAYDESPDAKWFLGISDTGHLAPSDLCDLVNGEGQNLVEVAAEYEVCGADLAGGLFDCQESHVDPERARVVGRAITTAVLEQVLWCADRSAAIAALPERFEEVEELRSSP